MFMIMCSKLSKNPRDFIGRTPLHLAAKKGHLEVVKCLASVVDHVNAKDFDGMTPMRNASIEGHTDIVNYLICVMKCKV